MSATSDLMERGRQAAIGYCERLGMTFDAELAFSSDSTFTARDGDEGVLVFVTVTRRQGAGPATIPSHVEQTAKAAGYRLDSIQILMLSEDRALLRHHRDAGSAVPS